MSSVAVSVMLVNCEIFDSQQFTNLLVQLLVLYAVKPVGFTQRKPRVRVCASSDQF